MSMPAVHCDPLEQSVMPRRAPKPLHIWSFDEQHLAARAAQEAAMRAADARSLHALAWSER